MVITQFFGDPKSNVPVTKNQSLQTVDRMEFNDNEGYESDFTANSKDTFQFNVHSSMFDTILPTITVMERL